MVSLKERETSLSLITLMLMPLWRKASFSSAALQSTIVIVSKKEQNSFAVYNFENP